MDYLEFEGIKIKLKIVKSSRKTISIGVNRDGVVVRAPKNVSEARIRDLVFSKKAWIVEKYNDIVKMTQNEVKPDYEDGSIVMYRGRKMTLQKVPEQFALVKPGCAKIWVQGDEIILEEKQLSKDEIAQVFEQWYRQQAKKRIEDRVNYYCRKYDFKKKVNRIVIKDQKSRWGSCSSKCNLNFNYRLIMAPDEVLDYVVVHELCHLLHMNHSASFWNAVEYIMPEYQMRREWLQKHGKSLT